MEDTAQFTPDRPSLIDNKVENGETLNKCASNWWRYGLIGGAITGGATIMVLRYGKYTKRPWWINVESNPGRGFLFATLMFCFGFYGATQRPFYNCLKGISEKPQTYRTLQPQV